MRFTAHSATPSVENYNQLRRLAGWPVLQDGLVEKGLSQTLFSIVFKNEEDEVVGMGRIVGDGAIYLHIQDVIVHPEFQRQGIGKLMMEHLLAYTKGIGGANTNIGLMCRKGREKFYKELGFQERQVMRLGPG